MEQRNYFWVFQNKTFKEEAQGGFLWAPQKDCRGYSKSHWTIMKDVRKGDVILHSVHGEIAAISFAQTDCYTAQKPDEGFHDWEKDGWRIDCDYYIFDQKLSTKDNIDDIVNMQPEKYAPINKSGRGNTGYLFSITEQIYEFLIPKILSMQTDVEKKAIIDFLLSCQYGNIKERLSMEKIIGEDEYINDMEADLGEEKAINIIDYPKKKPKRSLVNGKRGYRRDARIAANAIRLAQFKCEMDERHQYFISYKTGKNYVEAHHLVPVSFEDYFEVALDVEANIISLCPVCHKVIHHGERDAAKAIITCLYKKRKQRLDKAGIKNVDIEQMLKHRKE